MSGSPVRLRLSRARGFDLQEHSRATNGLDVVNCARPGRFGNPFTVQGCREAGFKGDDLEIAARVTEAFRVWIDTPHWRMNWDGEESEQKRARILRDIGRLRGKNLACFCKLGAPCHADVLLEIANRPICDAVDSEEARAC